MGHPLQLTKFFVHHGEGAWTKWDAAWCKVPSMGPSINSALCACVRDQHFRPGGQQDSILSAVSALLLPSLLLTSPRVFVKHLLFPQLFTKHSVHVGRGSWGVKSEFQGTYAFPTSTKWYNDQRIKCWFGWLDFRKNETQHGLIEKILTALHR